MEMPRPVVDVSWLAAHVGRPDLAVIDCRFSIMGDPDEGRRAHAAGHIPGAVYFHLDDDLSGPVAQNGGRHPLPNPETLAKKLGAAGIGDGVQVVVYDGGGDVAARMWFLLRWLGHDDVAVLDGGFPAWTAGALPVETAAPQPTARTFTARPRPEMIATMAEVRDRPADVIAVDARTPERFAGAPHPLDTKSGHIPGAISRFYRDALGPDGRFRPAAEQAARFAGLSGERLIHYCGSGVTSCANLLACELAGMPGGRLYVGSWSDWTSYAENPVAVGDE